MEIDGEDISSLDGFVSKEICEFVFGEQQEDSSTCLMPTASVPVKGVAGSSPGHCSSTSEQRDKILRLFQKNIDVNTAKSTSN